MIGIRILIIIKNLTIKTRKSWNVKNHRKKTMLDI